MAFFLFANNAQTTLAGPIAATATTINMAAGTGALFPTPTTGQQFALTLVSQTDAGVREIVYCTARSTDTCTVVRGQEGTSAANFVAGDFVGNYLTAATTAAFVQAGQLQQQAGNYAVDTGSTNSIVISLNPAPGSLSLIAGTPIRILVAHTVTGATTLTVNGLASTSVKSQDGSAIAAGQIVGGQIFEFFYNPGVGFEVISPYVMLSRANVWTGTQTLANNTPLGWNNSSGTRTPVVNLDGSNQVVITGGTGTAPIIGTNSAGQIAFNTDGSNNFFGTKNITSTGGRLRASLGAFDTGDAQVATLLGDFLFYSSLVGDGISDSIYQQMPSGLVIQASGGINTTGSDFINFYKPFRHACMQIVVTEGLPSGWVNGTAPAIFGAMQFTQFDFALVVTAWDTASKTWGLKGGIHYRYFAIGY